MRKIKITMAMAAGAILFVLSSCGQIEKPEDGTKVGSGIEKIVESDEEPQAAQNTKTTGNSEAHTGSDNGDLAAYTAGEEKAGTGTEDAPEIPVGEYVYVSDGETGKLVIEKTSDGYDISDYESEASYRFLADFSNIEAIEDNKIYIKYPEQVYADDTVDFGYYTLEYGTDEINVYYRKSLQEEEKFLYCAKKKQTDDTKQAEKEDVSGIYTDKQGTSDVYSELILALQADGTYAAEIGIYRLTGLKGTAVWEGDTLRFTSDDSYPYVLADISVTGSHAEVVFTKAGVLGIQAGDVYSFPDGAPNKPEKKQAGNAAFQPSLYDEIAAEISYAEEREKEITEKQKAADTQMDMNITAAEMYQMWDDTLNIVWGLLEANLNEADMEVLRKEEKEWIAFKDAEVQAAGQECEGGSIQPSVEASRAADLTKARVYELAEYAK